MRGRSEKKRKRITKKNAHNNVQIVYKKIQKNPNPNVDLSWNAKKQKPRIISKFAGHFVNITRKSQPILHENLRENTNATKFTNETIHLINPLVAFKIPAHCFPSI